MTFRLPLLERHKDELEKCVYCPKLCRATCPVSNAEPNESLIPWGKMSTAYFLARGDVPLAADTASVAWACTDCFACRERCDHKNLVGPALNDARAELFARDLAPAPARELAEKWSSRAEARRDAIGLARSSEHSARRPRSAGAGAPRLLLGCAYVKRAPDVAELAVRVTEALLGESVSLVEACCGYPLLLAGDRAAFEREGQALAREVALSERFVVLDPGCFRTIERELPQAGFVLSSRATLLVDLAVSRLDRLQRMSGLAAPRYHDPCQLGRGLGRYDGPRAILERVVGQRPLEFERARERADCAGSGGLLPLTRPEGSARIAADRIAEHERLGGGPVVTACGSSLHRLRRSGALAEDLVTYIARGLGLDPAPG